MSNLFSFLFLLAALVTNVQQIACYNNCIFLNNNCRNKISECWLYNHTKKKENYLEHENRMHFKFRMKAYSEKEYSFV